MLPTKTFLTKQYNLTSDFFQGENLAVHKLMQLTEDVATTHANQLGFGFDDMLQNNLLWVISKAKFVFFRQLTRNDKAITITTWPAKNRKFFCNRYYVGFDEKGDEVFCATYVWTTIDTNTRTLGAPSLLEKAYNGDFDDATPDMDTTFAKILFNKDDTSWHHKNNHVVDGSLLDANNHLNNTHYVAFATCGETQPICQLEINFQHELLVGESVDVYTKVTNNEICAVGLKSDGTISFSVKYTV